MMCFEHVTSRKILDNYTISLITILIILFNTESAHGQDIAINEVMASNGMTVADEEGAYNDWIELHNYGAEPVPLEGFGLSDDSITPYRWVFPAYTIQPGEYLQVWASGKDRTKPPVLQDTLLAFESEWKYLDDGSNQGTEWRSPEFNDSSWASGPATLGYGAVTDFGTDLSYGPDANDKHITYYFRKNIEIDDTNAFDTLDLTLMVDDGAIVYINNTEITRVNMPEGEVDYLTTANVVTDERSLTNHRIPINHFQNGTNTIAVEVHQYLPTSSDIRFDMELVSKGRMLHTNFSISADGEKIMLTNPTGGRVDELDSVSIPGDISYGRYPNGTGDWQFYTEPTPGEPNTDTGFTEILEPPAFSHEGGFYEDAFDLTLSASDPDVEIYYTLDGSDPDPADTSGQTYNYKNDYPGGDMLQQSYQTHSYGGPITVSDRSDEPDKLSQMASTYNQFYYPFEPIFKGTPVKARAFKENTIPSKSKGRTYFVTPQSDDRYSLPVISINTQEDHLFDYEKGIYVPGKILDDTGVEEPDGGTPGNYWQRGREWERPATLEFFEKDSARPVLVQNMGIRLHGGWSRGFTTRKSLRLYARGSYGNRFFNHKVFPDLPYSSYKRILLRNSGNDWDRTIFRDAAIQSVMKDLRVDKLAYRPAIVFINGEYWGIHSIRERYDDHYLNRVYEADRDNIDLMTIRARELPTVKEGDAQHYEAMVNYLQQNDMGQEQHYQYIQTQMDIDNFIDFQIAHIYAANTDWPGNNIDFWRSRTSAYQPHAPVGQDGRWRWMLFDTDFGFGQATEPDHNTLDFAREPNGPEWPNPPHSTVIFRRLLLNETFRNAFINRFADLLNAHFIPEYAIGKINEMQDDLEPEMDEHIARWGVPWNMDLWNDQVNGMKNFADERPSYQRGHIRNEFDISGNVDVTVDVSNPDHGHIRVNSLVIQSGMPGMPESPYPWTGIYFRDMPIAFEAVPEPGYSFVRWEGLDEEASALTQQSFSDGSASVMAHFEEADQLHYWHFNDLNNAESISTIPADYSITGDAVITYPGTGAGYMDRVDDGTLINSISGFGEGYGLRVRNPSDTRELLMEIPTTEYQNITLRYATKHTPNGSRAQTVYYRTSPEDSWVEYDGPLSISADYKTFTSHFTDPEVNDNPDFMVKIVFGGEHATGTSGNNRFDNIRVEGIPFSPLGVPIVENNDLDGYPDPEIYHSQQRLYVYNPYPGRAQVTLYDVSGMASRTFQVEGQGLYDYGFAPQTGIYIAKLVHEKKIFTTKILVD